MNALWVGILSIVLAYPCQNVLNQKDQLSFTGRFLWNNGFSKMGLSIRSDSTFEYWEFWDGGSRGATSGTWRFSSDTVFLSSKGPISSGTRFLKNEPFLFRDDCYYLSRYDSVGFNYDWPLSRR